MASRVLEFIIVIACSSYVCVLCVSSCDAVLRHVIATNLLFRNQKSMHMQSIWPARVAPQLSPACVWDLMHKPKPDNGHKQEEEERGADFGQTTGLIGWVWSSTPHPGPCSVTIVNEQISHVHVAVYTAAAHLPHQTAGKGPECRISKHPPHPATL